MRAGSDMVGNLPGLGHLRSLLTSLLTLVFLLLQPWQWWLVLAFAAASFAMDGLAEFGRPEKRQPPAQRDGRPFNALVYALFAMHWVNLFLTLRLVGEAGWMNLQAPVALLLMLLCSSHAVIVAHELIHRPGAGERWMGRLLLCSVFYEHFFTEHMRTHHAHAGTRNDPATAFPGEAFWPYFRRNLPAQFVNAWRLESARVERGGTAVPRILQNRVLQGLLLEAGLAAAAWAAFGWGGFSLLIANAAAVFLIVHAVHYFQHWGLERVGATSALHSWDTTSRSNLFSMIGMGRHADHHLNPGRPYYLLRYVEESPKLPRAYGGMVGLAIMNNAKFQRLMNEALREARELAGSPPGEGQLRTSAGTARSSGSAR